MVTTITVGTSGDYSALQTAWDNLPTTLTDDYKIEILNDLSGSNCVLDATGVTLSGHTILIEATSTDWSDLNVGTVGGVILDYGSGGTDVITIEQGGVTLSHLNITNSAHAGDDYAVFATAGCTDLLIQHCMIYGMDSNAYGVEVANTGDSTIKIKCCHITDNRYGVSCELYSGSTTMAVTVILDHNYWNANTEAFLHYVDSSRTIDLENKDSLWRSNTTADVTDWGGGLNSDDTDENITTRSTATPGGSNETTSATFQTTASSGTAVYMVDPTNKPDLDEKGTGDIQLGTCYGPSAYSEVLAVDFKGNTRSGSTSDYGPHDYTSENATGGAITATWSGTATFTAVPSGAAAAVAAWSGNGAFTGLLSGAAACVAAWSGTATFSGNLVAVGLLTATWSGNGAFTANLTASAACVAAWSGNGNFTAVLSASAACAATWSGTATFTGAISNVGGAIAAVWSGTATFTSVLSASAACVAAWSGTATFSGALAIPAASAATTTTPVFRGIVLLEGGTYSQIVNLNPPRYGGPIRDLGSIGQGPVTPL